MIELNKHPAGRINNMGFGVCAILDGLVRILSIGFLHSRFTLNYSKYTAKHLIKRMFDK